jgi:hypothetical protein
VSAQPYRPSNSDEGLGFEHAWCNRCGHDREWREGGWETGVGGCHILAAAYADQAAEWVYDKHGKPTCTAFVHQDDPLPIEVSEGQLTIEGGKK